MIDSHTAFIEHVTEGANGSRETRLPSVLTHRPDAPSAADTLAELERVVSSPDFPASPRNRRALEYIVQRYLEGRADELGAYHIATRVYGRPETFNPIKDPIVRIEMAKLRRDLEVYYLKSGARNPLQISIPKGGYVPQVSRATRGKSEVAVAEPFLVSVLRAAFCAWSGDGEGAAAAWQDLKLANPTWPANLQTDVSRMLGDEKVSRLVVEGALRGRSLGGRSRVPCGLTRHALTAPSKPVVPG